MADVKKYVSLDKLGKYDGKIKALIDTKDAAVLAAANAHAESLGIQYDAAGAAATVQENLDKEVTRAQAAEAAALKAGQDAQTDVDALELVVAEKADASDLATLAGKVGDVPEDKTVMGIINQIQENAYDDSELRGLITGLESNKADKTQVATDIGAAKTELQGKIDEKAAQSDLEAVSAVANAAVKQSDYDVKVEALEAEDTRIAGLVASEAERAAQAENALDGRLDKVETFFELAEGEQLDTALDRLVEIQTYLNTEGAAADKMVEDIAANAEAISDMDAAYKAADGTLQGNIDTLAGTVATKAAQADLEAAVERIETAEGDIDKNAEDIAALQAKFAGEGEGTVADQIADAVAAEAALRVSGDEAAEASAAAALAAAQAADAKAQGAQNEVDALELVVAEKAAQADLTALQGKVTTLEGDMAQAKTDIDTVEAAAAANAEAIAALQEASATHATKTELQNEVTRATGKEAELQAAIEAFVEVSEQEINDLFV